MANGALIDVPRIIGGISGEMDRILIEGDNRLLVQRTKVRNISFIKRKGVFSKDNGPIVSSGRVFLNSFNS